MERVARVGALYDLHGNLFALEAALADARAEDVDLVVFGGDLAWGPFPKETVGRVLDPGVPARYVRGNADREVASPGGEDDWAAEITRWCSAQLGPRERDFLAGQPETVTLEIERLGSVLFCHGSPRSDEESLTFLTEVERLRVAVEGTDAAVVVCGHTHMQFDRCDAGTRVVNAGSVGMPYEGEPGAYWCLLDAGGVSLRRSVYDYDAAAAAVRASGCPYATEMAKDLLAPPGRGETAAQFEAATP